MNDAIIRYEIQQNSRPLDLFEVTAALTALGNNFREHLRETGQISALDTFSVQIVEVRTGSLIADLAPFFHQAVMFSNEAQQVLGFAKSVGDLIGMFASGRGEGAKISRQAMQGMQSVLEPVARDGASQLNISARHINKIEYHFHCDSLQANAAQNSFRRELDRTKPPTMGIYHRELFWMFQARDGQGTKTANKAIAPKFDTKPVNVVFASEDVRNKIIGTERNFFDLMFVADIEVTALEDKPVLYKILDIHETMDKE